MKLKLYNTLTKKKEDFEPIDPNNVRIYSCGPTVYREPHIWNMRAFCFADLLRNTIKYILWYKVTHVMNLTDVGHLTDDWDSGQDKMEKWAQRENLTVWELADKYIKLFKHDLQSLRIEEFDVMPRATEHIAEQIDMIKTLISKWLTYVIPGDWIYLDTSKVPDYWKLIWDKHLQWIQQGARIQNSNKKNSTDFALRKFTPKWVRRQMEWIFDWPRSATLITDDILQTLTDEENLTRGFPWWHIECSAMSSKYLGQHFDIHTWWVDHIWVHHTNEIAQSECCFWYCWTNKKRVNYRLHNQFLQLWWKKLSKSKWWLITVRDIIKKWYSPLDLKFLYLSGHYRSFLDFNDESLKQAQKARLSLIKKIKKSYDELNLSKNELNYWQKKPDPTFFNFDNIIEPLLDDFNTSEMLAWINKSLKELKSEKFLKFLYYLEKKVLNIGLFDFLDENEQIIPQEIIDLAEQRKQAKLDKNYQLADQIRSQIQQKWFIIEDLPNNSYKIKKV